MAQILNQSQTSEALVFRMVSTADHLTPATGASPAVMLSKNGSAFAAASGTASEIGNGFYKIAGNATDTNTLGPLAIHATASGAVGDELCQVVAFNPRDGVRMGLTSLHNATARSSTGLPALADIQGNSTLGPAQTITDGDGTASLIQIATPFVGAAVGRGLRCTDTLETRQITAFSQNIGSGLWQYSVSPAFTTFTNPNAHTFAVVNLPDALESDVPGSYAAGTAGRVLSDIRKVVQARNG